MSSESSRKDNRCLNHCNLTSEDCGFTDLIVTSTATGHVRIYQVLHVCCFFFFLTEVDFSNCSTHA